MLRVEPWSFDNHLLTLRSFEVDMQTKTVKFDLVSIWVQLHDLPLASLMENVGRLVGSRVGEVLVVDVDDQGFGWGKFLHVRVHLDLSKPLNRGAMMDFKGT